MTKRIEEARARLCAQRPAMESYEPRSSGGVRWWMVKPALGLVVGGAFLFGAGALVALQPF